MLIRPAERTDVPAIGHIVESTELFPAALLEGMIAPYLAAPSGPERWIVLVDAGQLSGVAYFAPERFTAGTWNLLCIAVQPERQGRGHGRALLEAAEQQLCAVSARVLLVETSGAPDFAGTRTFCRRLGYTEEARLRDYYAPGDDKVVFRKALSSAQRGAVLDAEPVIRDAGPEDLPAVVAMAEALGRQHAGYDGTRFELHTFGDAESVHARYTQFFEAALEDEASIVKVAEGDGRVLGYAFARLEPASFIDLAAASGWLHDVYVSEDARRARSGLALVTAACAELTARGATRLRLSVSPHNGRARALFDALGFRPSMLEVQRDG